MGYDSSSDRPLYIISVAAELVNMHPQTLRLYERRGLVAPKRQGKNRLYSQRDIERLMYIQQLTQELGINLAGVEKIIRLQSDLEQLQAQKAAEIEAIQHRLRELEQIKREKQGEIKAIKQRIQGELEEHDPGEEPEEEV
ncbi:MAG: heat shock protein transcriptional repressor HspR [Bacteroidota bacterium]